MRLFCRRRDFHPGGEVDRHHRGDIGNRKAWPGKELAAAQPVIKSPEEFGNPQSASIRQLRNLRIVLSSGQRAVIQAWSRIPERVHYSIEALTIEGSLSIRLDARDLAGIVGIGAGGGLIS